MLKRSGAATAGTAAIGGTAPAERAVTASDGEQWFVRADVDAETFDPERSESRTCYGPCYSYRDLPSA